MSAPNSRPFMPIGKVMSKQSAAAMARKMTKQHSTHIYTTTPVRNGYAVVRAA